MIAKSVQQVIRNLSDEIDRCRRERSRLGFFAGLYREVTIKVMEGINSGRFEDGPRMERLDVIFANRYLEALRQFAGGERPSKCWLVAFQAAAKSRLLVLQHLLLGINAHINLDLGVAAAQACPGAGLQGLKRDFNQINDILSELLDVVQNKVGAISPLLRMLDLVGGRNDEVITNFSMRMAREAAWKVAERLAPLTPDQQTLAIGEVDGDVEALAHRIRSPGKIVGLAATAIRLVERKHVPMIIDVLT